MPLSEIWFVIVAFLFVGYFVLDGFDFGVGMSLPFLAKDDTDKRVLINTIGPVWDLNETWLIVAGASLFAAFPEWYASLFSGFYVALFLLLAALIGRGVAFEYRGKRSGDRWKKTFDWMIVIGSAVPALLWGVAFANIVQGVPLNADHVFVGYDIVLIGNLLVLLNPYALLGGLVTLTLFFTHGLVFLTMKTDGELKERARLLATKVGVVATVLAAVFLVWTLAVHPSIPGFVLSGVAAVSLIAAILSNLMKKEGFAFSLMLVTVATAVSSLFVALFPNVLPSTLDVANSLTIENASSSQYTLTVMGWVALIMMPLVLAYQGWTYWVFRKRIQREHIPTHAH
ncbi:MAG: cytochrome d ubiquinol oxidase subunit II [Candidatus Aquiluna sp.]|nr:cytochrome d ubiquinol oxidase subunit II [Aquiluna sp.]